MAGLEQLARVDAADDTGAKDENSQCVVSAQGVGGPGDPGGRDEPDQDRDVNEGANLGVIPPGDAEG